MTGVVGGISAGVLENVPSAPHGSTPLNMVEAKEKPRSQCVRAGLGCCFRGD